MAAVAASSTPNLPPATFASPQQKRLSVEHKTADAAVSLPVIASAQTTQLAKQLDATLTISQQAVDKEKLKDDWNLTYAPVEARWILSILDDTAAKLNLVSYLTPEILQV